MKRGASPVHPQPSRGAAAALWLVLLVSTPAFAGSQLLIGGGGATREAAQKWLDGYTAGSGKAPLAGLAKLAEGFPRIVKSDEFPGLKPGLQIALFGSCSEAEGTSRAAALKLIDSGIYSRASSAEPIKDACPRIELKALSALGLSESGKGEGPGGAVFSLFAPKENGSTGLVLLLSSEGELLDAWTPPMVGPPDITHYCKSSIGKSKEKGTFTVELECEHQVSGNAAYCGVTEGATSVLRVEQGKLKVKTGKTWQGDPVCGGE